MLIENAKLNCWKIAFRQNMKLIILFLQTILSLPTTNNELLQKLKAYQALTGMSDELIMQFFEKVGLYKQHLKIVTSISTYYLGLTLETNINIAYFI